MPCQLQVALAALLWDKERPDAAGTHTRWCQPSAHASSACVHARTTVLQQQQQVYLLRLSRPCHLQCALRHFTCPFFHTRAW